MKPHLLQDIRSTLKLSVQEMSDLLGVMGRTYYRYESGKTPIPMAVEKHIITLLKYPNVLNEAILKVKP